MTALGQSGLHRWISPEFRFDSENRHPQHHWSCPKGANSKRRVEPDQTQCCTPSYPMSYNKGHRWSAAGLIASCLSRWARCALGHKQLTQYEAVREHSR
jgi:hypothetical protein